MNKSEGRLALIFRKHSMKIVLFYSTFIIALTSSNVSYADSLYQRLSDGSVWGYTGTPCNAGGGGNACPGWQKLNADSRTVEIEAGGNNLYQRLSDGSVWGYTGTPCNAGGGSAVITIGTRQHRNFCATRLIPMDVGYIGGKEKRDTLRIVTKKRGK